MVACKAATSSLPSHLQLQQDPKPQFRNPTKSQKLIPRRSLLISLSLPSLFLPRQSGGPVLAATPAEREASSDLSRRISEALDLLNSGKESQVRGNFSEALQYFTLVVENYKDLALSEYGRVGRALALYEVGDREEAIAEMEDVSVSLKGYPEVHAALAAALYADKHAPLLAENQFTIATLLDPHYSDLAYVKEAKHWPPSLISSLQRFITLS